MFSSIDSYSISDILFKFLMLSSSYVWTTHDICWRLLTQWQVGYSDIPYLYGSMASGIDWICCTLRHHKALVVPASCKTLIPRAHFCYYFQALGRATILPLFPPSFVSNCCMGIRIATTDEGDRMSSPSIDTTVTIFRPDCIVMNPCHSQSPVQWHAGIAMNISSF